jgi:hypothetical protein
MKRLFKEFVWLIHLLLFVFTFPIGFVCAIFYGGFMAGFKSSANIFIEITEIFNQRNKN